jgi:transcription elongation GreA/GreB family factor
MARALLKKSVDDEVHLALGGRTERLVVVAVRYDRE